MHICTQRILRPRVDLPQGRRDLFLGKLTLLHGCHPWLKGYRLSKFPSLGWSGFSEDVT